MEGQNEGRKQARKERNKEERKKGREKERRKKQSSWVPPKRKLQKTTFVQVAYLGGDLRNQGKEWKALWINGANPPLSAQVCIDMLLGFHLRVEHLQLTLNNSGVKGTDPLNSGEFAYNFTVGLLYPWFLHIFEVLHPGFNQPGIL